MSDYTELKKAAEYAAQDVTRFADEDEEMRALQRFHEEVDPESILTLIAERDQLKSQLERLRGVMACVVNEVPRHTNRYGNAPGHCHSAPGIWDRDNGAKAGTECGWCKVWNAAVAMSEEVGRD